MHLGPKALALQSKGWLKSRSYTLCERGHVRACLLLRFGWAAKASRSRGKKRPDFAQLIQRIVLFVSADGQT